jgi:pyruvate formate lyase activating enzyme
LLVFKGIQKTTLIDFPGKVASTLFLPKCNFRCPFCYNGQLVLERGTGVEIPEREALEFLGERKAFLDGVCVTGGEPLLHSGLEGFLARAKKLGLLAKLDTNGSKPAFLKQLLSKNLLDYIAMDIKAAPKDYDRAAGTKVDLGAVRQSVELIKNSGIGYEFRTTVVPGFHSAESLLEVGKWLNGSKRFFLQQFSAGMPLLDPSLEKTRPFSAQELESFAHSLKRFFKEVSVRGI